jgi:hypothetical protein
MLRSQGSQNEASETSKAHIGLEPFTLAISTIHFTTELVGLASGVMSAIKYQSDNMEPHQALNCTS